MAIIDGIGRDGIGCNWIVKQLLKNEFQNSWPQIASQGFKDRFKNMWEYYLSYCEVGFIAGTTDVSHFVITK